MRFKNIPAFMFAGFKVALRYRFNFVVGIITTPLSVLIYYFLWKAIYAFTGQSVIKGYSFSELVGYYVVSMIVGLFIWIDIDKWIAEDIRKGQLVVDLLRPLRLFLLILSVLFLPCLFMLLLLAFLAGLFMS